MAHAMGLGSCGDDGDELAQAVRALNERLRLPTGLAALGVTAGDFDRIIDGALVDHCHKLNPREATREDYRALLAQSM
jgi:alcohol dehydrogenase class IV